MRGHHDMGGLPAGAVQPTEHDYAHWEKRVDALTSLLRRRNLLRVDELRRHIESLGPEAYDKMSYYERWIAAITATLLERGAITADELGRKMEAVKHRGGAG
ncbi:MAG TPA: nitrile hydratase [Stellaceae bacterium]|nr:nitrile hydratase [Stellaceae bacterium]